MPKEVDPKNTTRAAAYALWMKAPNPMVTFFKTFDVTNLIKVSRKRSLKFNMLLDYCIGRAAVKVKEFYILPVGEKLMQYDTIAVNTIVKNKEGEVSSCDLSYNAELNQFNEEYLKYTAQVAASCQDRDLSDEPEKGVLPSDEGLPCASGYRAYAGKRHRHARFEHDLPCACRGDDTLAEDADRDNQFASDMPALQ